MIAKARARFVRMSPRKIRYVIDLVRQKEVPQAFMILDHVTARAAMVVRKLILQAATSAKKERQVEAEALYVSKIFADGAGMMKRYRAMSMGRAGLIRKRLSHVTVELDQVRGAVAAAKPDETPTAGAEKKRTWKQRLAGAGKS